MTVRQPAPCMLTAKGAHSSRTSGRLIHCGLTACALRTGLKNGNARSWPAVALAILLAVPCLPVFGGDSASDRETLRGLKAIKVVVEGSTPDLEHQGLTRQQLQSDIEEQLRKAGINVDRNANEFLGLEIISGRLKEGPVNVVNVMTVAFNLGVYQVVTLNRDEEIESVAETWSTQGMQSSSPKMSARISRDTVGKLVDQFIKAYVEVNPK